MKKFSALLLAVLMSLSLLSVSASAAESGMKIDIGNLSAEAALADDTVQPLMWSGPAPQVTKIEAVDCDWMPDNSGRIYIKLKVTGIGHDKATFNGQPIDDGEVVDYFINYGNAVDGFYYRYIMGPITEVCVYRFSVTFTSVNAPYSKLTYSTDITIS